MKKPFEIDLENFEDKTSAFDRTKDNVLARYNRRAKVTVLGLIILGTALLVAYEYQERMKSFEMTRQEKMAQVFRDNNIPTGHYELVYKN